MNSLCTNWKQTIKITFSYALASILLKRILNFSGDQEERKKKKNPFCSQAEIQRGKTLLMLISFSGFSWFYKMDLKVPSSFDFFFFQARVNCISKVWYKLHVMHTGDLKTAKNRPSQLRYLPPLSLSPPYAPFCLQFTQLHTFAPFSSRLQCLSLLTHSAFLVQIKFHIPC